MMNRNCKAEQATRANAFFLPQTSSISAARHRPVLNFDQQAKFANAVAVHHRGSRYLATHSRLVVLPLFQVDPGIQARAPLGR